MGTECEGPRRKLGQIPSRVRSRCHHRLSSMGGTGGKPFSQRRVPLLSLG